MITLFRKIRKRLISNGNFSTYLFYAIGEVFLVVVGILIALQVNNWNEQRKRGLQEQETLQALHSEFSDNRRLLEVELKDNQQNIDASFEMLKYCGPQEPLIDHAKFHQLFYLVASRSNSYRPGNGVLLEIINSGKLNGISNTELKRLLSVWNTEVRGINEQEGLQESYRSNIKSLIIANGSMVDQMLGNEFDKRYGIHLKSSKFNIDSRQLLTDPVFENNVAFKMAAAKTLRNTYEATKKKLEAIISLIESEIDN